MDQIGLGLEQASVMQPFISVCADYYPMLSDLSPLLMKIKTGVDCLSAIFKKYSPPRAEYLATS